MLKQDYPELLDFNKKASWSQMKAPHGVKVAYCVSPEPLKEGECDGCRLKGCCLLVNPELVKFVDKRKKDGLYKFSMKDIDVLDKKYPETVWIEDDGSSIWPEAKAQYLIDYYQSSKILKEIVDKGIFDRLIDGRYRDSEIEFLYLGINAKWEKIEKVFQEIVPREPPL
ncbi:hypothetical protein Mpsy_3130 [Methanolobus psychrophilus R15]|nr:hypothetical protein Mpsy_3130 [Methanolobus psychrophilus R15]